MKTLHAVAIAQKALTTGAQAVVLVEVDADAPGSGATSTKYYGSRKLAFDSKVYRDIIRPGGLQMNWQRLRPGGGLAPPFSASMSVINQGLESNLTEDFFLDNDAARIYWLFITGSEVAAHKVAMATMVIADFPYDENDFTLQLKDDSDKTFEDIPTALINLADHPDAPLDDLGRVVPVPFGDLQTSPTTSSSESIMLAPCRCVDIFLRKYTAGLQNNADSTLFQYYAGPKRWGQVVDKTTAAGISTITSSARRMFLIPTHPKATNDVAGWQSAANFDATNTVEVGTSANLDLVFGGVQKLGKMTGLWLVLLADGGTPTHDIKYDTTSLDSGSGDLLVNLTSDIATYFTDTWELERLSVELGASGSAVTYKQVYLRVDFEDAESSDRQALDIFQVVEGWEDVATHYNDGAVVSSAGVALTNPVHQLEAIFRGDQLLNRPTAELRDWSAAATSRSGWTFAFTLDQQVRVDFLDRFAHDAGVHLFKDAGGQWHCVAMDQTRAASHYFGATENIAVRNPDAAPSEWRIDCRLGRTPVDSIINEVVLSYRRDTAVSGAYGAIRAASSHYRTTGTVTSVSAATGLLVDTLTDFSAAGVAVNDRVYIEGDDKNCTVTAVSSATQLAISPETGALFNFTGTGSSGSPSGARYWIGPSVDVRMVRSQARYKTVNPLGDAFNPFTGVGGYQSEFIDSDAGARLFIDHIGDWRAERRLTAEFATFLRAVDVELGDVCYFDHPALPITKRPVSVGTLNGAHNSSVLTLTLTVVAANAQIQSGDFVRIGSEVVSVTSVNYGANTADIVRGKLNTSAAAHASGVSVYQLRAKWYVTGLKPEFGAKRYPFVRVSLEEMPWTYKAAGRVVDGTGAGDYESRTWTQRHSSGWATWPGGRIVDNDLDSSVSYVSESTVA